MVLELDGVENELVENPVEKHDNAGDQSVKEQSRKEGRDMVLFDILVAEVIDLTDNVEAYQQYSHRG